MNDTDRMLNVGYEVELKKLGKITVKELCLEDILTITGDLAILLTTFTAEVQGGAAKIEDNSWITSLVTKPEALRALQSFAAATTNRKAEDFTQMPIGDWMKLAVAWREVMDWQELKELFIQLVPAGALQSLKDAAEQKGMLSKEPQLQ